MQIKTFAIVVATLCAPAVAVADDPQQITDQEADDIAVRIAALPHTNLELASLGDSVQLARGRSPGGLAFDAGGAYHRDQLGLGVDYRLSCRDDEDSPLAVCSSDTRSATVQIEARGGSDTAAQQSTTARAARWTLTDVNASDDAPTRVDGTTTLDYKATDTFAGDTWKIAMTYDATWDGVLVSLANGEDARPVGGTVDYDVTVVRTHASEEGAPARTFATRGTVTFAEGGAARIEVAGRRYHVDSPMGDVQRD